MATVQAPPGLVGLLVPLRESGSMLSPLFIAARLRQLARRKGAWVAGSMVQGLAIAAMGLVAVGLTGWLAGLAILVLLALFVLSAAPPPPSGASLLRPPAAPQQPSTGIIAHYR